MIVLAKTKEKKGPIEGFGRAPETSLTVQKSLPLLSLWQSDMSLAEFKILDTYLSRINSREPDRRTVVFTKGELEKLLGVTRINKTDLDSRLNGLCRYVDLEVSKNKIHKIPLFDEIVGRVDKDTGLWTIQLTCTQYAMKYIFNVEKLGYLRYKLRCITNLTSRYTYVLFMYLESNRFRKTWDVQLEDLRQLLNCTDEFYNEYKYFNQRILQRCQKELHEKSECRFSYVPIRVGRKTTAIRFTLETLADILNEPDTNTLPGQMSLDDYDDPNAIYAEALPSDFTAEQVEALRLLAMDKVPYNPDGALPRECVVADYFRTKVALMRASKKEVKHPYSYLKSLIEKD